MWSTESFNGPSVVFYGRGYAYGHRCGQRINQEGLTDPLAPRTPVVCLTEIIMSRSKLASVGIVALKHVLMPRVIYLCSQDIRASKDQMLNDLHATNQRRQGAPREQPSLTDTHSAFTLVRHDGSVHDFKLADERKMLTYNG